MIGRAELRFHVRSDHLDLIERHAPKLVGVGPAGSRVRVLPVGVVTITTFGFFPQVLHIVAGVEMPVWSNEDSVAHTVTFEPGLRRSSGGTKTFPVFVSTETSKTGEEFKEQVLGAVIGDPPWDTSMVWADAQLDLPVRCALTRTAVGLG